LIRRDDLDYFFIFLLYVKKKEERNTNVVDVMRLRLLSNQLTRIVMHPQTSIHTDVDIANLRKPYKQPHEYFGIEHLVSHEPFGQFRHWLKEAVEHTSEPNGFCLATATKSGIPSCRYLLLKGFDETGFKIFYQLR